MQMTSVGRWSVAESPYGTARHEEVTLGLGSTVKRAPRGHPIQALSRQRLSAESFLSVRRNNLLQQKRIFAWLSPFFLVPRRAQLQLLQGRLLEALSQDEWKLQGHHRPAQEFDGAGELKHTLNGK